MSRDRPSDPLQHYLDDLLGGAPEPQPEPKPEPEPAPALADPAETKRAELEKLLASARLEVEQATQPKSAPAEPKVLAPEPEPAPEPVVPEADPELLDALHEQLEWADNGRPKWAQETFEVLLFKVSGLTLAVPLISLGQIQLLTDELTPLFGQADWFMGLQPTPAGRVRCVNTAKFVMPERYDENFIKTAQYVISLNGVPWGLVVDSVEQPISLDPSDVKWRGARAQRPWLAGTVKSHMCALLDIPMMGKMLLDSDKNRAPGA